MPTLYERDAERLALEDALADALAGEGGVTVVEGPAGIGKSRLLTALQDGAGRRVTVLAARGFELERDFPFGVVRQLFEGAVRERPQRLGGSAAPAAVVFDAVAEDGASFGALHGLLWTALNLADERPLLLAVDDLQWADAPSLRFLAYLARRIAGAPILVAATVRSSDPGTDPVLLGELTGDPATRVVRPGALGGASVAAMIADRLGAAPHAAFATACREATGGNPLLLDQLLLAMAADGVPPDAVSAGAVTEAGGRAVSRTVLLRLSRLGADAAALAGAVAVLGAAANAETVAALTTLEPDRLAPAARALADAELFAPGPALAFTHPVIREAVYLDLGPLDRAPRHARAAAILRAAGAPPEQIAAQLLAAAPAGAAWAADLLRSVGRAAVASGAPEAGVPYLRRALEEAPGDPELLLELGAAGAVAGAPDASEHLRAAFAALPDGPRRSAAAVALSRHLMVTGQAEELRAFLRAAGAGLPGHARLELDALELMGAQHGFAPVERILAELPPRTVPAAPSLGELMLAAVVGGVRTLRGLPNAPEAERARATLADGRLREQQNALASYSAIVTLVYGDHDDGLDELWGSLERAHASGSLREVYAAHDWLAVAFLMRGELDEAAAQLVASREALQLIPIAPEAWDYLQGTLALVAFERGDRAAAAAAVAAGPRGAPRTDGARFRRFAELELLVTGPDPEAALAACDAFAADFSGWLDMPVLAGWRSRKARVLVRCDRRDEAVALAGEELALARRFGAPGAVAGSLRALGQLSGDLDLLREAVAVSAGTPARLEHVKAQAALGAALRRARDPKAARGPLLEALAFAAAHGIDGLAKDVRTELAAIGSRPRREAFRGAAALTPSERRVADLAVTGLSNRDIAQALFITPRTVEVHLSNAYRKLGVGSRRDLAGALTT